MTEPVELTVTTSRWEAVDADGDIVSYGPDRQALLDLIPILEDERTQAHRRLLQQGITALPPDSIVGIQRRTTHTVTTTVISPVVWLELLEVDAPSTLWERLRWWR